MAVKGGRCAAHQRAERAAYDERRGSAAERGYDYRWQKRRKKFLAENPECVVCGAPATDVDHIVALADGGADDEGNWQPMCHSHHSRKTARHDNKWGRG